MSTVLHQRARVAALSRSRTPDDPEYVEARQSLKAARIEDYIRRCVDAAPPLTTDQRNRLASLLAGAVEFVESPNARARGGEARAS